jgi:hypothetical protein
VLTAPAPSVSYTLTSVHDVELDCAGLPLLAIYISASSSIYVHDCNIASMVQIDTSRDVRLVNDTFAQGAVVFDSERVMIEGAHAQAMVAAMYCNDCEVRNSVFALIQSVYGVNLSYGAHNRVVGNQIEGNGTTDDGVVIIDESNDLVEGNTTSDFFDCGIETSGVVTDTVIRGNSVHGATNCGIGAWYWSSLRRSQIIDNKVDAAPMMLWFFRMYGLRPAGFDYLGRQPADDGVYFDDNVFARNVFTHPTEKIHSVYIPLFAQLGYDPTALGPPEAVQPLPGERYATAADFHIGKNYFTGNDFGAIPPDFGKPVKPGIVLDGCDNRCKQPALSTFPLTCK